MMENSSAAAKAIILCADDFAVHQGASLGIAKLAAMGRLSATSVMVLSKRWPQDAALLKDLPQPIDVGLHLDWTSDFAVASGHGMPLGAAMWKALRGAFDAGAARAVIERQLDAFETHWKAPPDHVDGHQHVQQFTGIREVLLRVLLERYGAQPALLPYLRISRAPPGRVDLKNFVIAAMGAAALVKAATQADLRCSSALLGVYDFSGDEKRYADLMALWLQRAPPNSIVMCHPAQSFEGGDAIGAARLQEFNYLVSDKFGAALNTGDVHLVRGSSWQ